MTENTMTTTDNPREGIMTDTQYNIFTELADTWDAQAMTAEPVERSEQLRMCADALRMMVDFKTKAVACPRAPEPFNYCPDCDGSFPCQLPQRIS
jgi:hypothetical protein